METFRTQLELLDHGLVADDLFLLEEEDKRQLEKWGNQSHTMFEWLAFMTEEMGELSKAISEWIYRLGDLEEIRDESIQLSTLAMKMAVMVNRLIDDTEKEGE